MNKNSTSSYLPKKTQQIKPIARFQKQIGKTNSHINSYLEAYKKRKLMDSKESYRLLNRSLDRGSSIDRSRDGSIQKSAYRTHHNMDFPSNILNKSIRSNNSNSEQEESRKEQMSLEEDFIKVEDFVNGGSDLQMKQKLNQEYNRMIEEIKEIQKQSENQQMMLRNVQKSIKQKKKTLANQKKPINPKQGLSSLEHQLNKQLMELNQTSKKKFQVVQKSNAKFKRQLQELKQTYDNLNDKDNYLVNLRREEEYKEMQMQKQMAALEKQRKQQTALLMELGGYKQQNQKLQERLNKYKNTDLPNLDVHKKHIQMLERVFMQKQIQKINNYLVSKREQAQSKSKAARLKQELSSVKSEIDQIKKKLQEKNKKKQKFQKQLVDKSKQWMDLMAKDAELEMRMSNK